VEASELVAAVVKKWRSEMAGPRSGVAEADLAAFEAGGARVPEPLRTLLLLADGTDSTDANVFRFLPLEEYTREPDGALIFADRAHGEWLYAVGGRVVELGGDTPRVVAADVAEFLAMYLGDDARLYGG
jgi:hypothetical protein